jgi:CDP-diacylglycerol---glycerol-3-phosphate 3-phosphatidyltransferase
MVPLNVPNVLTILRILAVPVLVVALLDDTPNGDVLAAIVFALASLTDLLDGYLARSRNWVTDFGKLMDPIADKLLIVAALVALVSLNELAAWVAMVIIAREFAVTAMRMNALSRGLVLPAGMFGKAKAVLQVAMVFAVILVGDTDPAWVKVLVYLTVAITVASGVDYFFGIRGQLRKHQRVQQLRN